MAKVLIVDDSPLTRHQIRKILLGNGFGDGDLQEAANGYLALKWIESQPVDLLLLDWNMPELNGIELVKKLRMTTAYQKLPIIMITSETAKLFLLDAVKAGVSDFVHKPVEEKVLMEKIRKLFPGA